MTTTEKIKSLAQNRFEVAQVEEFIATFNHLRGTESIIDSILQISTDQGDELEFGFFNSERIVDITLSRGKVYSCTYPISTIKTLEISELDTKWKLTIKGDKKLDYNVVKPATADILYAYEQSLRRHLFML